MQIKKSDKFLCLRDFYMDIDVDKKEIKYTKGITYISEVDGCITNNQNNSGHCWNLFIDEKGIMTYKDEPLFQKVGGYVSSGTVTNTVTYQPMESKMVRQYKLIKKPNGAWVENDGEPMKIGRIIFSDEILSGKPFSYWYANQEYYWEDITSTYSNSNQADRYNTDKPKLSMLDFNALEDTVKVLEFGANKYARDNWKKGLVFSEVLDSMLRHIAALQNGEWIDPESNLPHIGHIGCNAMFLGSKTNTMNLDILKEEFKKWQSS